MDGNVGCDKIWAKVQLTINNTSLSSENSEFTNGFKWIFLQPYGISENWFINSSLRELSNSFCLYCYNKKKKTSAKSKVSLWNYSRHVSGEGYWLVLNSRCKALKNSTVMIKWCIGATSSTFCGRWNKPQPYWCELAMLGS